MPPPETNRAMDDMNLLSDENVIAAIRRAVSRKDGYPTQAMRRMLVAPGVPNGTPAVTTTR
jgi:hypothetical protein